MAVQNVKHYTIRVTGKVQGVSFRANTQRVAEELDLNGWVTNEPDGSVRIEVEGPVEGLREFLEFCKTGPELAQVSSVNYQEAPLNNFISFEVI